MTTGSPAQQSREDLSITSNHLATQNAGPAVSALPHVVDFGIVDLDSRPVSRSSAAALDAAREIARTSRRRIDVPVRKTFVRGTDASGIPPLTRLYGAGGRSGIVAVKLYLALIWRCSSPPYDTSKPARGWATLLDLPDPEGRGTRRVQAATKTLVAQQLVSVTVRPGEPHLVRLLEESGTGKPYTLPSTSYTKARAQGASRPRLDRHTYFKLASELWTQGWIQQMSGAALVMLLVLLAEQAGQGHEVWISPSEFSERYRISHNTRSKGVAELRRLRLLTVRREPLGDFSQSAFERRRTRSVYRLADIAVTDPSGAANSSDSSEAARH